MNTNSYISGIGSSNVNMNTNSYISGIGSINVNMNTNTDNKVEKLSSQILEVKDSLVELSQKVDHFHPSAPPKTTKGATTRAAR